MKMDKNTVKKEVLTTTQVPTTYNKKKVQPRVVTTYSPPYPYGLQNDKSTFIAQEH